MLLPADVDHSTVFVKLLKKLRPAYDWVPAPAAAQNSTQQQPQGAEQQQQQQQQDGVQQQDEQEQPQGHWQARALSDATLKELKLTRPEKEVSSRTACSKLHCQFCLVRWTAINLCIKDVASSCVLGKQQQAVRLNWVLL
jgi:hypothetical protein